MPDTNIRHAILGNIVNALNRLEKCRDFSSLMPEVRVNLVYALPEAISPDDVAAVDGRITVVRSFPHASGLPAFGTSDHMARLIIETRKYDKAVNAGINFKCDSDIIEVVENYCRDMGITYGRIRRIHEPEGVRAVDGHSMPWKIRQLFENYGCVPRVFFEDEGWGKEPLHVLLGLDAEDVVDKAIEIAGCYANKYPI